MSVRFLLLVACLAGVAACPADERYRIYSEQQLRETTKAFRAYAEGVFNLDLINQLPLTERRALHDVRLRIVERGIAGSPIMMAASVSRREVYLPIQTLRFIDDFAALVAWLDSQGCGMEAASHYAGLVAATAPAPAPDPRAAFGLSDSVWDDPGVKDLSSKFVGQTLFFMFAHELGHIRAAHEAYDQVSPARAQSQEMAADAFALRIMRHVHVLPGGMIHVFAAMTRMESQLATTHPLSGHRLRAVGAALQDHAEDFVDPTQSKAKMAPGIRALGQQFQSLAATLDKPLLREYLRAEAQRYNWDTLRQLCPY